jgi:ATP-binding cassette subfamily B protein/subfamily B ATP-binding cassette protein MsbA
VRGGITFDAVSFAYEPGRPVLDGVNLDIAGGETVGLVGATGAGKTTLVGLVARFYDPTTGRVLIDGHDVRHVQLSSVRNQVSIVLQESFLFPTSIADNIAYGRPGASRSDIEAAGHAANLDELVHRLPEGYDTIVGERGGTLSGGERQRVAIARALAKDAPILILDEPTSALDAATEHLVFEALERLMEGRTTLVIAHRLSTIRRADRIVVLDDGRVAETGTHTELLAAGGNYAHLCALQTGTPDRDQLAGTRP